MKSRRTEQGVAVAAAAARRTKNQERPGSKGVGLSLISFANAKSKDTGYNPAIIKKQREFYKNAKIVKKYKKTVKQRNEPDEMHLRGALANESGQDVEESGKNKATSSSSGERTKNTKRTKKDVRLQSLREEYEKKREEKERERKERESAIMAKKEERERVEATRKSLRQKMLKRTSSGQPIMRYRIEHILQGLQNEMI